MKKFFAGKAYYPAVPVFLAFTLASCSGNVSRDEASVADYPVQWTEAYSMADLIEEPSSVRSREDLRSLLGRQWYASIGINKADAQSPVILSSCNDYLSVKEDDLRVHNAQEKSAFLELVVMCEATRLFLEATASSQSAVPAQPLTEELPASLPKSFALITSETETQRILKDPTISKWGEVNDLSQMNRVSEHRVDYHFGSGLQSVSILGRGDFNSDSAEDVLVSVQDTVKGGSYYDLRLFVLSVTESGDWIVSAQYPSW